MFAVQGIYDDGTVTIQDIITARMLERNVKDFVNSPVPAITPDDFLIKLNN